jgi:hypothetical protein
MYLLTYVHTYITTFVPMYLCTFVPMYQYYLCTFFGIMGILRFYSIVHSIDLIGTCLKIQLGLTYVLVKTSAPLLVTLFICSIELSFSATMALVATGSYRHHFHSGIQFKCKDLI